MILKSMRHTSPSETEVQRERDHRDAGAALEESEQDSGTLSRCHDAHVGRQLGFSDDRSNRVFEEQLSATRLMGLKTLWYLINCS